MLRSIPRCHWALSCSNSPRFPRIANVQVNFGGPRYTSKDVSNALINYSKQVWPEFPHQQEVQNMMNNFKIYERTLYSPINSVSRHIRMEEWNFSDVRRAIDEGLRPMIKHDEFKANINVFHSTLAAVPSYIMGSVRHYSPGTSHITIAPMGCVGGTSALAIGASLCSIRYPAISITVAESFASKFWKFGLGGNYASILANCYDSYKSKDHLKKMREFWISAGLFGDGAAACTILHTSHPMYKLVPPRYPYIKDYETFIVPDSEGIVQVYQNHLGLMTRVDKLLTEYFKAHVPGAIEKILEKHGLSIDDVQHWIVHPGGPKILETLESMYPKISLKHSWQSLYNNGNCASVSIIDVLHRTIHSTERVPKSGDYGLILGIGPGLVVQTILLQW